MGHSPLIDIKTGDVRYPWKNNPRGPHLVASIIDRFMVIEDIARGIGEISASVLLDAGSYHWPISINWDWSNAILSKPFRFEQFWLEHKDFRDSVGQWWQ